MEETLKQALLYHKTGLSVIPIREKDKRPAVASWKTFQTTRADAQAIEKHFTENPDDNIGLVTGRISGITVIDIDIKGIPEDELDQNLTQIVNAVCGTDHASRDRFSVIMTGSGGMHIYTKYIDMKTQLQIPSAELVPGTKAMIDIKSDGGYVLAPPSTHPNGREYTFHPSFTPLTDLLTAGNLASLPKPLLRALRASDDANRVVDWDKIMKETTAGNRNENTTRLLGLLIGSLPPSEWETVALPCAVAWNLQFVKPDPLTYKEVERIFRSIADTHIKKYTLED